MSGQSSHFTANVTVIFAVVALCHFNMRGGVQPLLLSQSFISIFEFNDLINEFSLFACNIWPYRKRCSGVFVFFLYSISHEQRSCFKKASLGSWTVVKSMKIFISYWPSARAVLGEYRPEVLAVARSVQKSQKRPKADILPVRSRASSRLKRIFNYFINITFCGMMWRIKKWPATDWRPSKCFGENDFFKLKVTQLISHNSAEISLTLLEPIRFYVL